MADIQVPISLNYSYAFEFERTFDTNSSREWMEANWYTVFYYIGLYLLVIFGGQYYMKTRHRFELRPFLAIWNVLHAMFSIVGACRTIPDLLFVVRKVGFFNAVCNPSYVQVSSVMGCWMWLMALSKVAELGDTIFIVLKKQKLIFLHWYHHITVLLYGWYNYKVLNSSALWLMSMNLFVHSIMYTYFALRALRVRVPRWIAMLITTLQLSQMFVGIYLSIFTYQGILQGPCTANKGVVDVTLLQYFSYLVLFSGFFYKNYINRKHPRKQAKVD